MYKFRYRGRFTWKAYTVDGHRFDAEQNKMALYFADGSVLEIRDWKNKTVKLGTDWVLHMKKAMEKESGQPITLSGQG